MNAGCYGKEIKDYLISVIFYDMKSKEVKEEKIENLNFTYRRGFQKKDTIILYGKFKKISGDKTKIKKQMELYEQNRNDTQPQRVNCCGSIFKNPPNHNAWKLIKTSLDESFYEGPVRLSKKHSNFFENDPNISADKVIKFIETIKSKVNQKYQIILDLLVQRTISGEGSQTVDLDEPWLNLVVEKDIYSQDFKAHGVLHVVWLKGSI